jgi:serine protease Do
MRRVRVSLAVIVLALAITASAVQAQEAASEVPKLAYGETIAGTLTPTDDKFADGSYFKPYVLEGSEGDELTVFLASEDFDPTLLLLNSDESETVLATDGNSDGMCNARLTITLPETGSFIIVANASEAYERGQFQLTLEQGHQGPRSEEGCQGFTGLEGTISVGDSIMGSLGSDDRQMGESYFQVWLLDNPRAVPYTIDLNSDVFDAALMLVRGTREVLILNDDSGDGGCHARIPHTPQDERPYRLVAVSRTAGQGGAFMLKVSEGLSPLIGGATCQIGGP